MTDYMPTDDGGLFDTPPTRKATDLGLRGRYMEPPFTTLERRGGPWLDRDREWKSTGIKGEEGRDSKLNFAPPQVTYKNWYDVKNIADAEAGRRLTDAELLASDHAAALAMYRPEGVQTSVFSPALCELVYRSYSAPGQRILDPFAGGSVRGVVAGAMARWYTGIELRPEQVEANRAQAHIAGDDTPPQWIAGDSGQMDDLLGPDYEADLIFSCPPYAYLEQYSDDPADLSSMSYPDFLDAYRAIIKAAVSRLRRDRFAVWTIGEVREKGGPGACLGLVADTVVAFRDAGAALWDDRVLLTPIGTAAVRAARPWDSSRKSARTHEYLLVFAKGDGKKAAKAASAELSEVEA